MLNSTTSATSDTIHEQSAYEAGDSNETFDNMEDAIIPDTDNNEHDQDDWGELPKDVIKARSTKKKDAEEVGEELKLLSDSDGTEDAPKKEKKKDSEEDEDEETEEDAEAEEGGEEDETKDLPKDSKGKVRIRVDGELFGIDPTAAVRTKIDGEWVDVPVSELQSAYSSKAVRDKAYEEVKVQQNDIKAQSQKIEMAKNRMRDLIDPVMAIIQDETKDPSEALYYLVDKMGGDPQKLYKRLIETNLGELTKLLDMSDIERENHFLKKETESLRSRDTRRLQSDREMQEAKTFQSHIDQAREKFKVSESAFVEAVDELERIYSEEDFKKLDTNFMVQYAAQRPHIKKAQELSGPYVEEIGQSKYSDLIGQLSLGLMNGDFTEDQVKSHLKSKFGISDGLKALNRKMVKSEGKRPAIKETQDEDRVISFDDLLD